jgi:HEAT repeat protein
MATQENLAGATAPAAAPGGDSGAAPAGAATEAPAGGGGGARRGAGGRGGMGGVGRVDYRPNPRVNRVFDKEAVDKAFEALKTFDWSMDYNNVIQPIDDAVVASHGDAAQRKDLETRVASLLPTKVSRAAKDYCCRVLRVIGTASSVPVLAALLTDKDCSHMARYALERIGGPEAVKALRDVLSKVDGTLKPGMIEGLAAARDSASVGALSALSSNADQTIAVSAIMALGRIGSPEAGKALGEVVKKAPDALKLATADASLVCAERLAADGKNAEAMDLYKALSGESQPKHVRLAATRGLVAAAGKQ